jgi:AI-2 transport protein TqsA
MEDRMGRLIILLACLTIIIAGMRAASSLINPFLLSVFIAILITPGFVYLRRMGLPSWIALLLFMSAFVLIDLALIALVGQSIGIFTDNLPGYQSTLTNYYVHFIEKMQDWGIPLDPEAFEQMFDPGVVLRMASSFLGDIGNLMSNGLLIFITIIFMLLEAGDFPAKIRYSLGNDHKALTSLERVASRIHTYMGAKTLISLITGALVTLMLLTLGVQFAALWGLVAFLLNFIPNIGSIIAAIPALLMALVMADSDTLLGSSPLTALVAAAGYVVINMVIGNFIEPRVLGRRLGLSTLVVFLSLFFWGWILGPVGMLLSVPLTMSLKIILEESEDTRWAAILMGSDVHHGPEDAT